MSKKIIFNLDLTSKSKFNSQKIEDLRSEASKIEDEFDFPSFISESIQLTRNGKIEIYLEDSTIEEEFSDEILTIIKSIESRIGGFSPGSYFSLCEEFSNRPVKWVRDEYSWDLEGDEEENNSDDDNYWENDWKEWNDEWE